MSVQGAGYVGSNKMESSIPNEEIVPESPSDWSYGYKLYKFAFMNNTECTITINKQTDIYLQAGQGFQIDRYDLPITSFKIRESGVLYNWSAAY